MEKRYLGVDWGKAKVGIALSFGKIAKPLNVYRTQNSIEKIWRLVKKEEVSGIIVGISEGESAKEAQEFGERLAKLTGTPVRFWDETLTSQEAQKKALEAKVKKEKRKRLEDAFAAALMLQSFIEAGERG